MQDVRVRMKEGNEPTKKAMEMKLQNIIPIYVNNLCNINIYKKA